MERKEEEGSSRGVEGRTSTAKSYIHYCCQQWRIQDFIKGEKSIPSQDLRQSSQCTAPRGQSLRQSLLWTGLGVKVYPLSGSEAQLPVEWTGRGIKVYPFPGSEAQLPVDWTSPGVLPPGYFLTFNT